MRSYQFYDNWNNYYSLSNKEKNILSNSSKETALKEWCVKQKDYHDAISQTYLPVSLHNKIKEIFINF